MPQTGPGCPDEGAAGPLPRDDPDNHGMSAARLARLDRRFEAGVVAEEIPGTVVLIARNGRLIYERAFGYADRRQLKPITPSTVFALASASKPVTSVAAMTLVEEGLLSLDEPISRYLPEMGALQVAVDHGDTSAQGAPFSLEPVARQPTVQDLLRHTSGFVYGQFGSGKVHKAYMETRVLDLTVPLTEMVRRLAALPLAHQPGTTFEYSVSTDVLGRIIEVVSGQPLDRYLEQHVTGPLGLTSLRFHVAPQAQFAWPTESFPGLTHEQAEQWIGKDPLGLSGGGGLYGTAGDYLRFAQMMLNGGELDGVRILSPKTVELMASNHLGPDVRLPPNMPALLRIITPMPEMGQGFGLGFAVRTHAGRNPAPGSVGEFYWAGATGTYFWIDPAEKLIAVVLTAQPKSDIKVLYRQLARQLVYQAVLKVSPARVAASEETALRRSATSPSRALHDGGTPDYTP